MHNVNRSNISSTHQDKGAVSAKAGSGGVKDGEAKKVKGREIGWDDETESETGRCSRQGQEEGKTH